MDCLCQINCTWDRSDRSRSTHRTDRTDRDLDGLHPGLPLSDIVKDLYSTDPIQETCARPCRLYGFQTATGATAVDHTDQVLIFPELSRSSTGNISYRSSVPGVNCFTQYFVLVAGCGLWRGISVLGGPRGRRITCRGSFWWARVWVRSGGREIRVPSGSGGLAWTSKTILEKCSNT